MQPMSTSSGWASLALCLARVTMVYWEEFRCDIEVIYGEDNRPRYSGVEILMPSIGARHFLGAMPMIGDYCVCGWFAVNSDGTANKKTPAILSWLPRTPYLGHEWVPTQDFSMEESLQNSPKDRAEQRATLDRLRHKLRHYEPGNVGATSAQGSDIHLDESVLISNRRANEIRLRDQDQAIVTRSLQQFHSMAGARVYGGMIQRDARSLPKEMFIQSEIWDQPVLFDGDGQIINLESYSDDLGQLNPHPLFAKDFTNQSNFEKAGGIIPETLNPYIFLYQARLVDDQLRSLALDAETYGGKSILRIGKSGDKQDEKESSALVEYRIDVCHTSDGTLPVNEETDGFDVDRLLNPEQNLPFIEFVLGTPVGNDPYSDKGISQYGKPLYLNIAEDSGSLETVSAEVPVVEQLATLLSVKPIDNTTRSSVSGYTKGGAFRAYIGSDIQDALKARIEGGLSLITGARAQIESSSINLRANGNNGTDYSLNLSTEGAISLKSLSYINVGSEDVGDDLEALNKVGLLFDSVGAIHQKSTTGLKITTPVFNISESSEVKINALDNMEIESGDQMILTAKTRKDVITGKHETVISGPPDFNPIYGAVRETTIGSNPSTGFPGGIVDKYTCAYGDRLDTYLTTSNVSTVITSGSHNTTVAVGTINQVASTSAINLGPTGVSVSAATAVSINSGASVSVNAVGTVGIRAVGASTVSGATVVLGAPGAGVGFIMCATDRDPTTGRTFLESGLMLPRGQLLAPSII